jgi:hypothetical protein
LVQIWPKRDGEFIFKGNKTEPRERVTVLTERVFCLRDPRESVSAGSFSFS